MEDKAKGLALKFLSYRPRTTTEVVVYLQKKGIQEPLIKEIIDYLKDYRYIDDKTYAEAWARDRFKYKGYGRERIKRELQGKQINQEIVGIALNQLSDDDEYRNAKKLIERRIDKSSQQFSWPKLANYLLRKGYNWEVVKKVLNSDYLAIKEE